jgi:hypothetical protein
MFSVMVAVLSGAGVDAGARVGECSAGFGGAADVAVLGGDGGGCQYDDVAAADAGRLRHGLALGRGDQWFLDDEEEKDDRDDDDRDEVEEERRQRGGAVANFTSLTH